AVTKETARLPLLINNAGIGSVGDKPGRHESGDGHELRFAVNYLAGFLLTHLLLPLLKASKPARIVNVSSAGQQAIDFDDVMLTKHYSGSSAYCQSKLAQIMFTVDLAGDLAGSGVIANALHPSSYMNTTMVKQSGATPSPSLGQRADPTQPFPKASPVITRFHDDPRVARLEGYLQALADRPMDWGDYPVLVGFFAATFQRHPDWIDKLLPDRFDAKI